MTRTRTAVLLLAGLLSLAAFAVAALVTAFVACGVSGCSGGGFGPSFDPVAAQVGLIVTGATLVPLALLALPGRPLGRRLPLAAAALAGGTLLAVVVTGIGPNGCPVGQSRATEGAGSSAPGNLTCSSDVDAD